jgi:hypothetical protein
MSLSAPRYVGRHAIEGLVGLRLSNGKALRLRRSQASS